MNNQNFNISSTCPYCGGFIFNSTEFCPYCGAPLGFKRPRPKWHKPATALLKCLGFYLVFILTQSLVSALYTRYIYAVAPVLSIETEEALYQLYMRYVHYASAIGGLLTIAIFYFIYTLRGKRFTQRIELRKLSPASGVGMAVYGLSFQLIIGIGLAILYSLFPSLSSHSNSEAIGQMLEQGSLVSRILNVAVVTGITEEIVFRGLIYKTIKGFLPKYVAIAISAIIFGAAHMNPEQFFYTALLGVLLCLVYEKCRTILAPIIVHVVFNGTNFITMYLNFSSSAAYIALFILSLGATLITTAFLFLTKKESLHRLNNH